jgi:threonine dehydratase
MLLKDPSPTHRLALADFETALGKIAPEFLNSPQYNCEPLSDILGCALTLKVETANPIRSFKGRGANYLVQSIRQDDNMIVSASAGNWGQALAYSCRQFNRKLIMFASINANQLKLERMRALGADVRLSGNDFDASKIAATSFAETNGFRMVADGLDPEASIGAGTMAIELLRNGAQYDAILVPTGNGAMLTGIGRWIKAASPQTKVIGVQSTGADAMEKSWRSGKIIVHNAVSTIADGIGVRIPIPEAVGDMHDTVDDVLLVEDHQILQAMKLVFEKAGLLVEPSGAAGVAAILSRQHEFKSLRVATILCGGNITADQINKWILPIAL